MALSFSFRSAILERIWSEMERERKLRTQEAKDAG